MAAAMKGEMTMRKLIVSELMSLDGRD